MPSTATNRLQGLTTSVAVKPPCITVATANITLSGLQTISGVTVVEDDRVLVKGQSTASENGIYNASTGSWTRAKDFDGDLDAVSGTRVLVRSGSSNAIEYELTTADPIVIGTTSLTFTLRYGANATYDITEAEIAAGVTPPTLYIPSFPDVYVDRYVTGTSDTVSDAWSAIEDAVAVINAAGGGRLRFNGSREYVTYVGSQTGAQCLFEDLEGIEVYGGGALITVDTTRVITASLGSFLQFDNCKNIIIDGFVTNGPTITPDLATFTSLGQTNGVEFARFVNGCDTIHMGVNRIKNFLLGVICNNANPSTGMPLTDATRSKNIVIDLLHLTNCWYGLHSGFSGDNCKARIVTDTIYRSVFCYGLSHLDLDVHSKDHGAVDVRLMSWHNPAASSKPLKDIKVKYKSGTDSDGCIDQQKVYVGTWGSGAQEIDGVDVTLDVEYPASGGGTDAFTLVKTDDSSSSDTTTRGHTIKNIAVRGRIKGQPTSPVGGVVSTDPNCDFTGETLSGRWIFDLDIDTTSQVYLELGALSADAVLDLNVNINGAIHVVTSGADLTLPHLPRVELNGTQCTNRFANLAGPIVALEYMNAGGTSPTCYAGWCKGSLKWLTTRNAGGTTVWALPAATVGMRIGAMRTDAQVFRLDPNGSEVIRGGGAGKYYGTNTDGASLILFCQTAGTWEIEQERGTWAFEP